jgi:putative nucleotidyltransferase with HDIG domain
MLNLAQRTDGNLQKWGLAGLLHDIDLPTTRANPTRHGIVGARIILELGFDLAIAQAVKAHDDRAGIARTAAIDHALYCADRAFWAIHTSGVDPKNEHATAMAVIEALKQRERTDRIDENLEDACEALGITLAELLTVSMTSMRDLEEG